MCILGECSKNKGKSGTNARMGAWIQVFDELDRCYLYIYEPLTKYLVSIEVEALEYIVLIDIGHRAMM